MNAGADVIITSRNYQRIDAAISELQNIIYARNLKSKCYGAILDNSKVSTMKSSFLEILSLIDDRKIDFLVNNAGISRVPVKHPLKEEEEFVHIIDTNLKGTYFLLKIVSSYMIDNHIKGNILNIASTSSNRPITNAYALSKLGIKGLTVGYAKVLIKHGIVVNGIAPGPTLTPMMKNDGDTNLSLPNNPSGRYAMPEEIGNMAVILTSDIGKMVVGDVVFMGGGAGIITIDDIKY